MTRRVLVTGGAGFIGANLCRRLLGDGCEVVCLDDFSSGLRRTARELAGLPGLTFVEHDVCEPFEAEVDAIFNLACPASPPFYQADPLHTLRTCFQGTLNVLELARRRGIPMLHTSTSEVYGDPLEHPQREDYRGNVSCTGPRACYDEGKRVAETLCFDYLRTYGTDVRVVRIFNTYGPGMRHDDGRVVSNLVCQALRGEDMTVYGDGSQTRSFCYVDDLVEGLVRMMAAKGFHGPVNLGNPTEVTVAEFAEMVCRLVGSESRIVCRELPQDDPMRRRPAISLAAERLGWAPSTSLEDGLLCTIEHFRKELHG